VVINRFVIINLEIYEYASYIGFDLENDKDLIYIAIDGLKAPVPEPWVAC
jgi:centrosomal protein CEP164